jgi:hypothetical protein
MIVYVPCDAIVTGARHGRDLRTLASRRARDPRPPRHPIRRSCAECGVSFAENDYIDKASSSELAQEIDVYRGTASRAVMRRLGAVATACPWYTDPQTGSRATVSEEASPRFAEGGYVITVTDPAWRSGTTLVAARSGTAVVTVLSTDGADNGHASAMRLASQLVSVLQGVS